MTAGPASHVESRGVHACAVVPVYNHAETLVDVVRGAARHLPVIVVDDGSTDGAPERLLRLQAEVGARVLVLRHPSNRGKGVALAQGFRRALELGYTHAITLDADGQHDPDDIPLLLRAVVDAPEATVLGRRDLRRAGAPRGRRWRNQVARAGLWAATGEHLVDTQTGFRGYPLAFIRPLGGRAARYDFELEMLVLAAWSGAPILEVPIRVDYARPSSRRSHIRVEDQWHLAWTNSRMALEALLLPRPVRVAMYHHDIVQLPMVERVLIATRRTYGWPTE